MRSDSKTPEACRLAWADEFLKGTMTPQEHFDKLMGECKQCKNFDECYPPYEKMDEGSKRLYNAIVSAMMEETMGEQK